MNNDLGNISKNVADIVNEGIKEIDNEVNSISNIEEQSIAVAKDLLMNNNRSKVDIDNKLYMFLLSTGSKRVIDYERMLKEQQNGIVTTNDIKMKTIDTYILTVYDAQKVYNIQKDNNSLLEAMNKFSNINTNDNLDISPKTYKPYKFELEADDNLEIEQMLNTLCKTAIGYLSGQMMVEELPNDLDL